MAKVMLVEDDNNLREIYEARLMAEGYEIISAQDGEEALALAVKHKPDLIIADIMMPKISGFDMLDILRSTPETKDTKVIMMTALSQAEDKERANKLGADRYLVKSQVTLEDVARVAHEVLEGKSGGSPNDGLDFSPPQGPSGPTDPPAPIQPSSPTQPSVSNLPIAEPPKSTDNPVAATTNSSAGTSLPFATAPVDVNLQDPIKADPVMATDEKEIAIKLGQEVPPQNQPAPLPVVQPPAITSAPVAPIEPTHAPAETAEHNNNGVLAEAVAAVSKETGDTNLGATITKHSMSVATNPQTEQNPNNLSPSTVPAKTAVHNKTINPINDIKNLGGPNLEALLMKEQEKTSEAPDINMTTSQVTVSEVTSDPNDPRHPLMKTSQPPIPSPARTQPATDPSSIAL